MGNYATLFQNVFADRQTDTLLLFVTDERKMRIKQVVGGIALSFLGKLYNIDQHVRKSVACHGAIRATLEFEIQKQAAIAGKNRKRPKRSVALKGAQR